MADVTGRGIPDLIFIATENISSLSAPQVLGYARNNGDGSFQQPTLTPFTNITPTQFVLGDFNGDGKLDLMVVSVSQAADGTWFPSLVPLLGNGNGTFTQGTAVALRSAGYPVVNGILAVDVNGDGKLDLLVSGISLISASDNNALYELIGNGDGTFQAPKLILSLSGTSSYFAAADLNHDGIPDLVELAVDEAASTRTYRTYLGQPGGAFQLSGTFEYGPGFVYGSPNFLLFGAPDKPLWPLKPTLGDFNGDGNVDILAYLPNNGGSAVISGSGSTTIITGAWNGNSLQVLAGNGDGTFTPSDLSFGLNNVLVPQLAASVDNSARTDLVELDLYSSSYDVLMSSPGNSFALAMVSSPVIGTAGKLQVALTFPSSTATTVNLSASDPNISIAPSVTIAAGTAVAIVPFQIGSAFNPNHVFSLIGQVGSETHTAYATQGSSSQGLGYVVVPATGSGTFSTVVEVPTQPASFEFWIASLGGYSTEIQPSCQGLPAGVACQFSPSTVLLGPGSLATVGLTVTSTLATPLGTYSPTAVFTDGSETHQLTIPLAFAGYSISLSPSSQSVPPTGSTTYDLLLTGTNGYIGPVQITYSGFPTGATPEIASSQGVDGTPLPFDVITHNVAPGSYVFTITATAGAVSHSASSTLVIAQPPDFTLGISPASATGSQWQNGAFNLQIDSLGGDSGLVSLACTSMPSGVACAFAPPSPSLPANGSVTVQLLAQVNPTVAAGAYPVTVTATDAQAMVHQATATLQVQTTPPPGFSGTLSPATASLSVGGSAKFGITLNSKNGATGALTLACLNVPSGTSCAFSPTSPTLPANGSVSDQLTVTVNSRPASARPVRLDTPGIGHAVDAISLLNKEGSGVVGAGAAARQYFTLRMAGTTLRAALPSWRFCAFFVLLLITAAALRGRRRVAAILLLLLLSAVLLLSTLSCGGGGGGGGSQTTPPAPVSFTITVQAGGAGVATPANVGMLTITVN